MSLSLELVLGVTSAGVIGLAADETSPWVAYPASGVMVLLDTVASVQAKYLVLDRNVFTCSAFSKNGQHIVTGEKGYKPAVRVWDVQTKMELAAFFGHSYGIRTVQFSPVGDEIVSIGLEKDNLIKVWTWPLGNLKATNSSPDPIMNFAYSEDGSFFVTVGPGHFKFWYPRLSEGQKTSESMKDIEAFPLPGRPGVLSQVKESVFMDVDCGSGWNRQFVYAVTLTGHLAVVESSSRVLTDLIAMDTSPVTCVKSYEANLFLGLASGEVVIMSSLTKQILTVIPSPKATVGCQDTAFVRCLVFNPRTMLATILYSNKTLNVLDLANLNRVRFKSTCLFHEKAITGIGMFTPANPKAHQEALVTTSNDSTVRIWDVTTSNSLSHNGLTVLFLRKPPALASLYNPVSKVKEAPQKTRENITALRVISEGSLIVLGTDDGSVYIYSSRYFLYERSFQPHRKEVTCFAHLWNEQGCCLLASGGRDRMVHIMDASQDYRVLTTLAVHSSMITSILFVHGGLAVSLISCGPDRAVNLCVCRDVSRGHRDFTLEGTVDMTSPPVDMVLDAPRSCLAVGCRDGRVSVCQTCSLHECRGFRATTNDSAHLHKLVLSPDGRVLLTATSDRRINVLDFASGRLLNSVSGCNDRVTGMAFSGNGRHVLSVTVSGCLFAWRFDECQPAAKRRGNCGRSPEEARRVLAPELSLSLSLSHGSPRASRSTLAKQMEQRRDDDDDDDNDLDTTSTRDTKSAPLCSKQHPGKIKSILKKAVGSATRGHAGRATCLSRSKSVCNDLSEDRLTPAGQTSAARVKWKKVVRLPDDERPPKFVDFAEDRSPGRCLYVRSDGCSSLPIAVQKGFSSDNGETDEVSICETGSSMSSSVTFNQLIGTVKYIGERDHCGLKACPTKKHKRHRRSPRRTVREEDECPSEISESKRVAVKNSEEGIGRSASNISKAAPSGAKRSTAPDFDFNNAIVLKGNIAQKCMVIVNDSNEEALVRDMSIVASDEHSPRRTTMKEAILRNYIVVRDGREMEASENGGSIAETERDVQVIPVIELKGFIPNSLMSEKGQSNYVKGQRLASSERPSNIEGVRVGYAPRLSNDSESRNDEMIKRRVSESDSQHRSKSERLKANAEAPQSECRDNGTGSGNNVFGAVGGQTVSTSFPSRAKENLSSRMDADSSNAHVVSKEARVRIPISEGDHVLMPNGRVSRLSNPEPIPESQSLSRQFQSLSPSATSFLGSGEGVSPLPKDVDKVTQPSLSTDAAKATAGDFASVNEHGIPVRDGKLEKKLRVEPPLFNRQTEAATVHIVTNVTDGVNFPEENNSPLPMQTLTLQSPASPNRIKVTERIDGASFSECDTPGIVFKNHQRLASPETTQQHQRGASPSSTSTAEQPASVGLAIHETQREGNNCKQLPNIGEASQITSVNDVVREREAEWNHQLRRSKKTSEANSASRITNLNLLKVITQPPPPSPASRATRSSPSGQGACPGRTDCGPPIARTDVERRSFGLSWSSLMTSASSLKSRLRSSSNNQDTSNIRIVGTRRATTNEQSGKIKTRLGQLFLAPDSPSWSRARMKRCVDQQRGSFDGAPPLSKRSIRSASPGNMTRVLPHAPPPPPPPPPPPLSVKSQQVCKPRPRLMTSFDQHLRYLSRVVGRKRCGAVSLEKCSVMQTSMIEGPDIVESQSYTINVQEGGTEASLGASRGGAG